MDPCGSRYEFGYNLGVAALLGMLALLLPTLWVKIPYHRWKRTHEWFGALLLLVVAHILAVKHDVAAYPLLRFWMCGLLSLAVGTLSISASCIGMLGRGAAIGWRISKGFGMSWKLPLCRKTNRGSSVPASLSARSCVRVDDGLFVIEDFNLV